MTKQIKSGMQIRCIYIQADAAKQHVQRKKLKSFN
jgi:hypothetical protein